jgi:excisionase family DNA binding protein
VAEGVDSRSEALDVAHHVVGNPPTLLVGEEVLYDLVVGREREERGQQGMADVEAGGLGGKTSHTLGYLIDIKLATGLRFMAVPEPRAALFVRIPATQARQLEARAHSLGRTKQDLVSDILATSLVPAVTASSDHPRSTTSDDVLTLEELARMLKLDPDTVMVRVDAGELPGRRFGDQWRFSRQAVLAWLDGIDNPGRARPGFAPSPRAQGANGEALITG